MKFVITKSIQYNNMNCNSEKNHTLNISTSSLVLTPLTCASIVGEILKCLIYQKSQIPYPYIWLKNIIGTKRKQSDASDSNRSRNMLAEKQYRMAALTFDTIEGVLSNIRKVFKYGNNIREILVLFGATPMNPKEIYRFNIPLLASGHKECNHVNMTTKFQHKILRSIFLSEEWMYKMEQSLPLTNLHVFLKMDAEKTFKLDNDTFDFFIPSSTFSLPRNSHSLTVNLLYDDSAIHNCCNFLRVYEDNAAEEITKEKCANVKNNFSENNPDLRVISVDWLKVSTVVKGFKESFINKVPVSNLW